MKPVPAVVQSDIAHHAAAVDRVLSRIREGEHHVEAAERRVVSAREVLARLRVDLGNALAEARKCWPPSGPRAKGWTDFLKVRGIDPDVADDAMKYAGRLAERFSGDLPEKLPTMGELGLGAPVGDRDAKPANVHGASGEKPRGAYCTPRKYAEAVGRWDLDPFTNPRSHIVAGVRCMLEDGGDGFGDRSRPGTYRIGAGGGIGIATAETRVFIQPDYRYVDEAIAHYGHTRFCALLRFAPDVAWFAAMWPRVRVVAIPYGERIAFEAPDGIEADGAPFPHAFFYADERDVTDAIRALCLVWRVEHQATNTVD